MPLACHEVRQQGCLGVVQVVSNVEVSSPDGVDRACEGLAIGLLMDTDTPPTVLLLSSFRVESQQ